MPQTKPRTLYGIHEVALYHQNSGIPYGNLRVLAGSTLSLAGELVPLTGGSSAYAWDAQDGNITAEISLKPKEIPNFLISVLLGKEPTEVLDDVGNVANFANVLNATVFDAVTGIATATVKAGSESDLKFGKYIVLAVSPTTVDIYAASSVDFLRGSDLSYIDDSLKINATPLTITLSAATEIPGLGVELTGGTGAIAMVAGDTAEFEVNPPSLIQADFKIGEFGACVPEFGAVLTAQKEADGSMWLFDCYRVKALGFPFGMESKAYNEAEITGTVLYDATKDGVFNARYLKPASGCN